MEIVKNRSGNALTVKVSGRIDSVTSAELEDSLQGELDDVTDLTFDFSELEYISSAGLRILLFSQRRMNKQGKMKVTGINDTVREIFEVTGFLGILTIE
ncbi:MAG TPA: anti-sigma factor antagonist [Erysipelotrichaceae bacterium]|nr:anti-sigma factor antagonist [Erysipelotrichaceae bacterium]